MSPDEAKAWAKGHFPEHVLRGEPAPWYAQPEAQPEAQERIRRMKNIGRKAKELADGLITTVLTSPFMEIFISNRKLKARMAAGEAWTRGLQRARAEGRELEYLRDHAPETLR